MEVTWWGALPLVALAAVALVLIGWAVAWALRWSPLDGALAGPGLGVVVLLCLGVVVRVVGLPWHPLVAAVGLGLVILVARLVSPSAPARLGNPEGIERRTWPAALMGIVAGGVASCAPVVLGIPGTPMAQPTARHEFPRLCREAVGHGPVRVAA